MSARDHLAAICRVMPAIRRPDGPSRFLGASCRLMAAYDAARAFLDNTSGPVRLPVAAPYYARDGMVWAHPVRKKTPTGERVRLGFPICKMTEVAGDEQAEAVAELMNLGSVDAVRRRIDDLLEANNTYLARARSAEACAGRLRQALTPSGDTKAAYHGEAKFQVTQWRENDDEEWEQFLADVTVPWTTVKEIMALILARADAGAPGATEAAHG